jgi:hypothetical protein
MLTVAVCCSTADVPMLAEQAAVENKLQDMQLAAAPEEPVVSGPEAVRPESLPKVFPNFKICNYKSNHECMKLMLTLSRLFQPIMWYFLACAI